MNVKMINRAVSIDMGHMTVRVNELTDYEVEPNAKAYELSLQYERQTLERPPYGSRTPKTSSRWSKHSTVTSKCADSERRAAMSEQTIYPTGEDMLADLFASTQVTALKAYLANYEPDPTGTSLKTTDAIIRELDDMVEVGSETVALVMLEKGFSIVWHPNGRHGWAMRLLV